MAFSYGFGANPPIDYVRLLISDTAAQDHIFEDEEISAATVIQQMQFQSSMTYSGGSGRMLPSTPVSYLRVAALLLDAVAANRSRLAVNKLLDANVDFQAAAKALREQAAQYRQVDDDAGAFMIIEQCSTAFNFMDRFYKQVQRQNVQ